MVIAKVCFRRFSDSFFNKSGNVPSLNDWFISWLSSEASSGARCLNNIGGSSSIPRLNLLLIFIEILYIYIIYIIFFYKIKSVFANRCKEIIESICNWVRFNDNNIIYI